MEDPKGRPLLAVRTGFQLTAMEPRMASDLESSGCLC